MTLLEAARQALPGLEWFADGISMVWAYPNGGVGRVGINGRNDNYHAYVRDRSEHHKTAEGAARWLCAQVVARREALDAALGEPSRAAMAADLTALRERMRWQDVADDCPDACVDVQVYNGHVQDGWLAEDGYFRDHDGMRIHNVTHWRPIDHPEPLPAAPEVPHG